MLDFKEECGLAWVPFSFPEAMSGPKPQGLKLAAWKKQLKDPDLPRLAAIDCIDLALGLLEALNAHHLQYYCSPSVNMEELYYDVCSRRAAIYGSHIEPDIERDCSALAKVFKNFFDLPCEEVIPDKEARLGIIWLVRSLRMPKVQKSDLSDIVKKFRSFRECWLNERCGRPLGAVACLHVSEWIAVSTPVKAALITALRAFHQVALISVVDEEKEEGGLVFSALQEAGLRVRHEIIPYSATEMPEAVDNYRYESVGNNKAFVYITVSTIDRNEPRLPCMVVNADQPAKDHTVALYRRKVRLISGRRAPPVEQGKFSLVEKLLESEKIRLKNKYLFFNAVAEQRISLIDKLADEMHQKDPGPVATVWLDDALNRLASEMQPVGLHFFGRTDGKKNIQAIQEKLWEESTYTWSSEHFGFRI